MNQLNSGLRRLGRPQSKNKRTQKRDNYQDLARELKELLNMKVAVIPIVIGALRAIPKSLVKGLKNIEVRGQVEIIQTTSLLRSARILRRVPET